VRGGAPYQSLTFELGGGLNLHDAPDRIEPHEAVVQENYVFSGRGRLTPRRAMAQVGGLLGSNNRVIGIFPFPHGTYDDLGGKERTRGGIVITYNTSTKAVSLRSVDAHGEHPGSAQGLSLWTEAAHNVTDMPEVTAAEVGRRLFIAGHIGSNHLPMKMLDTDMPDLINEPAFRFEGTQDTGAAARPRVVAAYNNMLFMAGHGTTHDPYRPETVRFSYLGLDFDPRGRGDAGADSAWENLFDTEDYFQVAERGVPVVAMRAAAGRLVICTPRTAHTLFGYDRDSFQLELLDNQRGCVATNAMVEAAGFVWWWSPLGPVRYGGNVEDISYKISPVLRETSTAGMFAAHSPLAKEVRFFHQTAPDTRAYSFNYEVGQWAEHRFGMRLWSFGAVSEDWSGPAGELPPVPTIAPPRNPRHTNVSQNAATFRWDNGTTETGIVTDIYLRKFTGGSWPSWPSSPTATVAAGVDHYLYGSLDHSTPYQSKCVHRKGTTLFSGESGNAEFTTSAPAPPPSAPQSFTGMNVFTGTGPPPLPTGEYFEGRNEFSWGALSGHRLQLLRKLHEEPESAFSPVGTSGVGAGTMHDLSYMNGETYSYRGRFIRESDGTVGAPTATVTIFTGYGGAY